MTANELKVGDSFQYRQAQRWSNNFVVKSVINWPQVTQILFETTSGRNVMIARNVEVKVA